MSYVRALPRPLAPSPRAMASHCFAQILYIMVPVGLAAPVDRVVGHFSGSILSPIGASSPLRHRTASPPRKIQSA